MFEELDPTVGVIRRDSVLDATGSPQSTGTFFVIGFTKVLDDEVAIFRIGQSGFVLQHYFQNDWAANFMMQLVVDDLDAW
jgi:hypothetical protein